MLRAQQKEGRFFAAFFLLLEEKSGIQYNSV